MSWDQVYQVPSLIELVSKLTGQIHEEILKEQLYKFGFLVTKIESTFLDDDPYRGRIHGLKVTLRDLHTGKEKVFVQKLYKKYTSGGNYGCDYYGWFEEKEKPKVEFVDEQ